MMVDRLLIAFALVAVGVSAWVIFNRLSLRRVAAKSAADPLLADSPLGTPIVVYFTTPTCVPCRTLQSPALAQLKAELNSAVQIIQVDACEQPEVADRWGVFSSPTTFVLDHNRVVRHVNRGVAPVDMLKRQLGVDSGGSANRELSLT